jgi:hypothetical protein
MMVLMNVAAIRKGGMLYLIAVIARSNSLEGTLCNLAYLSNFILFLIYLII